MSGPDGQGPEEPGERELPRLPGFREMALRRMAGERRRLVAELTGQRQAAGLSQTQVAARMGTSQSAVARLEAGEADVRASTLERYAAAIGSQISWRLQDPGPAEPLLPGPLLAGPVTPGTPVKPARPVPPPGYLAPAAQLGPSGRQEDSDDHPRS
jgi:transcriptional regulator with XRE-family HTH domain